MESTIVVALYEDRRSGLLAARDLTDHGFDARDVTILSGGPQGDARLLDPTEPQKEAVATGAGVGAIVGGAAGIAGSLLALTIPGVGPILAAGPLIAGFVGASTGAIAGALIGGLVDMGIPEHHAHAFLEGVRNGGTLVMLHVDPARADEAADILRRRFPMDLDERILARDESNANYADGVLIIRSVTIRSDAQPPFGHGQSDAPPV